MTRLKHVDGWAAGRHAPAWVAGIGKYWLVLAALVFFACYALPFFKNWEHKTWTRLFVVSAKHMRAGEPMHRFDEIDIYTYPPAMALVSMPLAALPGVSSLVGWYLLNCVALAAAVACSWKLAGGDSLVGLKGKALGAFSLGLVLSGRFLLSPLENHQFDMIIVALVLSGCVLLARGRDLSGGAVLGIGAAFKCTPGLFGLYLLWRGKFKAACLMGLVVVSLNLVPDRLFPQTNGNSYLADWYRLTLRPAGEKPPGQWIHGAAAQSLNQSLGGLVHRYLTFGVMTSANEIPAPDALALPADPGRSFRSVLIYGTGFLLLVVTGAVFGQPLQRSRPSQLSEMRVGLECGAIVCLMLLLSPMSSKSHYAVVILPAMLLARAAMELRERWLWSVVGGLLVIGPLSVKGVLGKQWGDLVLMWGFPTWYVVLLLVGIWMVARRLQTVRYTSTASLAKPEFATTLVGVFPKLGVWQGIGSAAISLAFFDPRGLRIVSGKDRGDHG